MTGTLEANHTISSLLLRVLPALLLMLALAGPAKSDGAVWALPASTISGETDAKAFTNEIAVGRGGTAATVWLDESVPAIMASIRAPFSSSFSAPINVSGTSVDPDQGGVVVGPDGSVTVVWAEFPDGVTRAVLAATRPPGGSFSEPVVISGAGARSPEIAIGKDGGIKVVFERNNRIQVVGRPAGSTAFSTPVAISPEEEEVDGTPDVEIGPDGTTTVVWRSYDPIADERQAMASTQPSDSDFFSQAVDVSAPTTSGGVPVVASGPGGQATIAWTDDSGKVRMAMRGSADTPFSAPLDLSEVGGGNPEIASGPDGTVTVVWPFSDGPLITDDELIQASTMVAGAASFSPPVPVSIPSPSIVSSPRIAIGLRGRTIVTWLQGQGAADEVLVQASVRSSPSANFAPPDSLSGLIPPGSLRSPANVAAGPCGNLDTAVWTEPAGSLTIVKQASLSASACPPTKIGAKVAGPARTKKGSRVIFRVTVRNLSDGPTTGVKVTARSKTAQAVRNLGAIRGGGNRTIGIPLKFKTKGKTTVTFTVTSTNAGKKTVKKVVQVG